MSQSYWDLSIKERASLTGEQVKSYEPLELMEAGALRVEPLELVDEPEIPEPDIEVYTQGTYSISDMVAWPTRDLAAAQNNGAAGVIKKERIGGYGAGGRDVLRLMPLECEVVAVARCYSEELWAEAGEAITQGERARAENEQRSVAYNDALEKQRNAVASLWDDWRECGRKAIVTQRVLTTLEQYRELAKDEAAAMVFLRKAFSDDDVAVALSWDGPAADTATELGAAQ